MSKYLVSTTEVYRVATESEVNELLKSAQTDDRYVLTKYASEYKTVKAKGEIVDEFYKVTLTKDFTDIKEPEVSYSIDYQEGNYYED